MLIKDFSSPAMSRLRQRFENLYGARAEQCAERLAMLIGRYGLGLDRAQEPARWTEKDVFLITYGDMVQRQGERPLRTLDDFLARRAGNGAISTVHILPFSPYSSDDGFSVIDYREVDPALGTWDDIERISGTFRLMADVVLNHCSRQNAWFREYVGGIRPGRHFFIEVPAGTDLSAVVRPRNLPLLTATNTRDGQRFVWTTFSDDQIDLNFANPDVLFEFLDILMFYITKGATVFRLDAIAYLWKKIGTSCIHLPETHEVVKLFRDFLEMVAPNAILLTETNVPHAENISYFGHGDEAHMVYQFSLPPLLLHALQTGNAAHLTRWASSLGSPYPGCTYLNFTASHDGIGVRPLEGMVPPEEFDALVSGIKRRRGHVSTKANPDGSPSPYELNITYLDALADPAKNKVQDQIARFILSQTVAMELKGIPAVYFHSLVGTTNDYDGVKTKGYPRAINRKKWDVAELDARLDDPASLNARIYTEYVRRLRLRTSHPAFHPNADQKVIDFGPQTFCVRRSSPDGRESVIAVSNVTAEPVTLHTGKKIPDLDAKDEWTDLLTGKTPSGTAGTLRLAPYQTVWLRAETNG